MTATGMRKTNLSVRSSVSPQELDGHDDALALGRRVASSEKSSVTRRSCGVDSVGFCACLGRLRAPVPTARGFTAPVKLISS